MPAKTQSKDRRGRRHGGLSEAGALPEVLPAPDDAQTASRETIPIAGMRPLAAVDEARWEQGVKEGVFLFQNPASPKEDALAFDKRNRGGSFQGAYRLKGGEVVVFRSKPRPSAGVALHAYRLVGGREDISDSVANFRQLDGFKDHVVISEREVLSPSLRRQGIASLAFDKLEADAAAKGKPLCRIPTARDDFRSFAVNRGYHVSEQRPRARGRTTTLLEKRLPDAPKSANLQQFHRFTVVRDGRLQRIVRPQGSL